MNIFVACTDGGDFYPSIRLEGTYWACANSFDDIVQLMRNAPDYTPFVVDYIYELTPGTTGYVNRWKYDHTRQSFDLWNE
jgi:hypothetical protein